MKSPSKKMTRPSFRVRMVITSSGILSLILNFYVGFSYDRANGRMVFVSTSAEGHGPVQAFGRVTISIRDTWVPQPS